MTSNMRIGFDAKRAFNNKTGLGNYSRFVLDALASYGEDNEYFAYTPKYQKKSFPEFQSQPVLPQSWIDKKLTAYWRHTRITKQLTEDQIDVFHGLSHELPLGLKQAGIASVVTIHDLIFERLPQLFNPIDRLIYRYKFKSACARADRIIAISEQTKRDLVTLYGIDKNRIQVIYQDCNPIFKEAISPEIALDVAKQYGINGPYVLSVGTIEERKNQLRLVQAFAQLPANNFQLVLVGRPTRYAEKIRAFIQLSGLEKRVVILENVPTQHLPALYQKAEVFAYISVYEGFGIPILESLHSGTPVLAAKGSCLEEAGGPGGLYANPEDVNDIASCLEKLISDRDLRTKLVQAGKEHVNQFSSERIAAELLSVYKDVKAGKY